MHVLIVGNGYAGGLLSYFLWKEGLNVSVVDKCETFTSTKVSAGIMLPLTGRRIVKTYNADKIIPFASEFYSGIEQESGIRVYNRKNVLQLFSSHGNRNEWFARSEDPAISTYTGTILETSEIHTSVNNSFGAIILKHSGSIDPVRLISAIGKVTEANIRFHKQTLEYNDIRFEKEGVIWNNQFYSSLIFCEGYETIRNPWFKYIPFKPAKGEILDFYSEQLDDTYIINSNVFILPLGNGHFRAGSTYNWNDLTPDITQDARITLEEGIRNSISCEFNITGHKTGIRPTIIDRRPVMGFHPQFRQLGIFNGLGTKGAMLAPYYASLYAQIIASGKMHDDFETDIRRFESLYQAP